MKDNLYGGLALALALALPGVSLAQTYEVTGGRPSKATETGRSGQASSWPSSVGGDDLKDAPSGTTATTDTKAQDRELEKPKTPRRWWQFWRWFEKDATDKNPEVR